MATAALVRQESAPTSLVPTASMDLASLTEQEFEKGLERIELSKRRMKRLLDTVLVKDAHYGNPKQAFKKDILFLAGAEELQKGFRYTIGYFPDKPDAIDSTEDFVQVTVHRCIYDISGRLIDSTSASCSSKEKRFKRQDGGGFTYTDAREVLNDIWAMAEKRAKVRLVRSALGITAFLATEEEMEKDLKDEKDAPVTPMTDQERKEVYAAAQSKGLGKKALARLVEETLGRNKVGTGDDVKKVIAAIAAVPAKAEAKNDPAAPADAAATNAPAAAKPDAAAATPATAEETEEEIRRQDAALKAREEAAEQGGQLPLGDRKPNRSAQAEGH